MEGVPPSCNEDDVSLTSNQFDFQSPEDSFNISELLLSPPEVPGNQSFMLCNDHGGQNMVVDNNVINDSIQQTTDQFPPSFPQTMMEGFLPFSMEDNVNFTSNQFDLQSLQSELELLSSPTEVPGNQSFMLCNDHVGQNMGVDNNVINDSIQQTTQFPPSFPQTMMEGFPPSSAEADVVINWTSNEFDLQSLEDIFNIPEPLSSPPEVPDNQSSILCNDQGGQNNTTMGGLDGTSSSWINQNEPNWPQTPSRYLPHPNLFDPRCANPMLPGPSMPLRSQYFSNQGQVDQAAVIPNIDNVQQENFVPRSQMDNLQVRELQNQTARPNASNPGLGTSLQSQNRGLNTRQVEMVRSKDLFWNYIEDRTDGSMKCEFCPHTFANRTSISRIKWHLSGEEGHNVAICHGVPKEVQEAAWKAMCGGNKRHKITAGSINVNDCGISTMVGGIGRVQREVQPEVGEQGISSHAIAGNDAGSMTGMRAQEDRVSEGALESRLSTEPVDRSLEHSNAILGNLAGGAGRIQEGVQVMEQDPGEERIQSHLQAENGMENTGEGSFPHNAFETVPTTEQVQLPEPRGGSSQFCLDIGRCYDQPCAPSVNDDVNRHDALDMVRVRTQPVEEEHVENSGRSVVQVGARARSSESLKYDKTRGVPLPTSSTKPVDQAFEENTKVIWSLLMDEKVSSMGIYGMGGVGKSTILQHIHNELLQRPNICDHVWWVIVSQDFSINRLQNLIAKHLHLDLSRKNDDLHRAATLSKELMNKQKWILILDDLWNNFKLHEVGIPEKLKGCKLILTTRSETVCHGIACDHKIQVKPLFEGEAWTLFKENLGCDIAFSSEVEGIAKDIARECAGLPLGIITVAGSLRGVDDLHQWRNTLMKLKESKFRDMKVFKLLRLSYDRLGDLALQQCLLYCALFPEDHRIEREELIGYLIDVGIIKGMRSRKDAFDEGHTMLNRVENVCLLESVKMYYDDIRRVKMLDLIKMHDLIRDMAIQILLENSQGMVKAGAQLKELPDAEEWTENLTRVSLMQNKIEEIPSSHSPRCPYLSTLFLCDNRELRFVADSFFKQLNGLMVLDLSFTGIENLPDSVSDLVSLTALLLKECKYLCHVPSLKKLRALKRLDLSHTFLDEMPQGMECLTNLRYLRMNGCGEEEFPSGILPKLSHLQVFVLEELSFPRRYAPITVKGKEVGSLRNLETLECHFEGLPDFVEYLRSRDGIQSLSTYKILVGEVDEDYWARNHDLPSKTVGLGRFSTNKEVWECTGWVKLLNGIHGLVCEFIDARSLSLENAPELELINIWDCNSLESLVSSSWFCSAPPPLPSYNGIFSGLKEIYCCECQSMKKLFPLVLLSNLVNLEKIFVRDCEIMEEIIGATDEESSTSNSTTEFVLPKLRSLTLLCLPELKSICSAKLICNSLEHIEVAFCEKLKRMPICLPLLENGQPSPPPSLGEIVVYPKEWWERVVEWEHPNAKDVLRPLVSIQYDYL